jgi:hypothetical protein
VTFGARPHLSLTSAPSTGVQSLGGMVLEGATPSSNNRVASLTLNPDGTITYVNQMADPEISVVPLNWYLPTTAAIGNNYRVRFTLQSGFAWTAGLTSGTLYALSSARTVSWTLIPTEQRDATVLVEITSSANTTVLGSGTLSVNLVSDY